MLFGQIPGAYFGIQYGSFSMEGLSGFQTDVVRMLSLPLDKLENFPNYIGFEFGIRKDITKKYHTDAYYNYISTGSRMYYEDYSGRIYFDQIIRGNSIGIHNQYKLNDLESFHVLAGMRTGMTFSRLSNEYYLKLEGITLTEEENYEFKSINGHISPTFSFQKNIGILFIVVETRYEFHIKGKLKSEENKDNYLVDAKGDPIKADWNGFRMMLALGINF
jgi:hypothetical protein